MINFILLYYLDVTDFLSCHEKAHDNREFSRENSKPCVCVSVYVHIYI